MNYFVEGLQGSGKSTLIKRLSELHPENKTLTEGDYSPVELAWCAYMGKDDYRRVLERYPDLRDEISSKSHEEGDHMIVCFTKIPTENRGFYQDLEQYEIYNNRRTFEDFRDIVLTRYKNWTEDNLICECSLFQNIVEDMLLFRDKTDEEIMDLYREIKQSIGDKEIHIAYIKTAPVDIRNNLDTARKERVDDKGNEVWFQMLCGFFDNSPHAERNGLKGADGLIRHWTHRQELELRICEEIFAGQYTVLPSKSYGDRELEDFVIR